MDPKELLRSLFDAAVNAAIPKPEWFAGLTRPKGRTIVVGAGKAAASMARAFEESADGPLEGIVVTRYGHAAPTKFIQVIEASHPIPDGAGVDASRKIMELVHGLSYEDRVVALISGGGSSLLTLPAPGVTLEEKQEVSRELLRCGAAIGEINTVRKQLSAIKGGKLLAACAPASVVSFILSDVPGDNPEVVASGPSVPSTTTAADALSVLSKYGLAVPASVSRLLQEAHAGAQSWPKHEERLVGSSMKSLQAASEKASGLGLQAHILSDRVEGESREVAQWQAALAVAVAEGKGPFSAPCVLLSGGETTVTVRGNGKGGRNVEFLAALARALGGRQGIYALAADTDGVDGTLETAGAFVDPATVSRSGLRLDRALDENDAHTLFTELGDAIVTGPTLTNVNDFRAILIIAQEP